MEGYPINEFNNYTSYSNISSNESTCSTEIIMENLGDTTGITWAPILYMKERLINHLKCNNQLISNETENKIKELDEFSDKIIQFIKEFTKQLIKMDKAEEDMKKMIEETQKDITIMKTFIEFLNKISSQYNKDTDILEKHIQDICKSIEINNKIDEIKQIYIKEKTIYFQYLSIIKLLNQMNVGSTCSICLQENVDSFFNPCGHTACSTCCKKNASSKNICPLCRKAIHTINRLYFN